MSFIKKLNRKLNKMFDGQVTAHEENGCLVLSGELERWNDTILAGKIAAEDHPYIGLINDIECTGEKAVPVRKPRIEDGVLEWEEPDVLIIGGGIIGCAIARELSAYKLNILLVEKEHDLAMQASGRNSGTVHTGFDLKKGTQKNKYCKLGNPMFDKICSELGVDFKRPGQFLCFTNKLWEPFMFISLLYRKWLGIKNAAIVKNDELHRSEPAINRNIGTALFFPDTGVVCPISLTIAYAENAVQNGVQISLDTMVQSMDTEDGVIKSVATNRGTIRPKVVVNAAGIFSDDIAAMAEDRFFTIRARKGTNIVLDKKFAEKSVRTVVSSLGASSKKKRHTKGGAVRRTINGNLLVGPDAVETINKEDFTTAFQTIKDIMTTHKRIVPGLAEDQIISYYSGIRAATYEEDFIVSKGKYTSNIVHAAGIQSPGLTAAPAIGIEISQIVIEMFGGENKVGLNQQFNPVRSAPPRPAAMDAGVRAALIESNPDYGIIICRCEEISKGEVINALRRNIKCDTIDGVKRRIRTGSGRCQGSFCGPQILDIIASEKRLPLQFVKKGGGKSEVLFGSSKAIMQKRASFSESTDFKGKSDPETEERLRERAKDMLLLSLINRKDDNNNE